MIPTVPPISTHEMLPPLLIDVAAEHTGSMGVDKVDVAQGVAVVGIEPLCRANKAATAERAAARPDRNPPTRMVRDIRRGRMSQMRRRVVGSSRPASLRSRRPSVWVGMDYELTPWFHAHSQSGVL